MQRKWRRFDGRIWSRVEFLQCQRSRRIFTVGITVFLRFSYRMTQSNGSYLTDWLIDWLIIWCFTPYRHYFGHTTAEEKKRNKFVFVCPAPDYCKRIIFSVYDIWRNFNFGLFSVDLNLRFILIILIIPKQMHI